MSNPLHLGIACYPTFGGSGIVATEIGVSLAQRGHRVHFLSYDVPGRLDRFLDNVYFHEVSVRDYPLFEGGGGPYTVALASKIVELCRFEPLDLIHVHYAVPHATSALLAKQVLEAGGERAPKIITTLHGTDITLVGSDPAYLPITRYSILQSDGLTAPSHWLQRETHAYLDVPQAVPIEVIPNFVDTTEYAPAPANAKGDALRHLFERAPMDLDWNDPQKRPRVLVHSSNFRPLKRVEDAVRVLAEVRRRGREALLVLIGDGPERSRVEALARELGLGAAVCLLGKQQSFVEVLRRCDCFLLPSEMESFGLAALEALACGVPVIATRVGGVSEVIVDGECGYLCPVGDVGAMADGVCRLLDDSALHARFAAAARERAVRQFERGPMVERYEEFYWRTLEGGGSR